MLSILARSSALAFSSVSLLAIIASATAISTAFLLSSVSKASFRLADFTFVNVSVSTIYI